MNTWKYALGNVDKRGDLENNDVLLDKASQRKLKSGDKKEVEEFLSSSVFNFRSLGINKSDLQTQEDAEEIKPTASAIDFEDIDELASDEEEDEQHDNIKKETSQQKANNQNTIEKDRNDPTKQLDLTRSLETQQQQQQQQKKQKQQQQQQVTEDEDLFPKNAILSKSVREGEGPILRFTELFFSHQYITPFWARSMKKKKSKQKTLEIKKLDEDLDEAQKFVQTSHSVCPDQLQLLAEKQQFEIEEALKGLQIDEDILKHVEEEEEEEEEEEQEPVESVASEQDMITPDAESLLYRTCFLPLDQMQWEDQIIWQGGHMSKDEEHERVTKILDLLGLEDEPNASRVMNQTVPTYHGSLQNHWGVSNSHVTSSTGLKQKTNSLLSIQTPITKAPITNIALSSTNLSSIASPSLAATTISSNPISMTSATTAATSTRTVATAVPVNLIPPTLSSVSSSNIIHTAPENIPHVHTITTTSETAKASKNHKTGAKNQIELRHGKASKIWNEELLEGDWTDCIIWDDEKGPKKIPNTKLILNMNDPTLMFIDLEEQRRKQEEEERKLEAEVVEYTSNPMKNAKQFVNDVARNVYNVSNDREYEEILRIGVSQKKGRHIVRHSLPALRLDKTYFRTHIPDEELRRLHRPRFPFKIGQMIHIDYRTPKKEKKNRRKPKYIEKKSELSAHDHRVILMEYIEKKPPMLNNIGMATKICNYYKMAQNEDHTGIPKCEDGIPILLESQESLPLLGNLTPGEFLTSTENSMFSAQIFKHKPPTTDFLLTSRKTNEGVKFLIREIPLYYTVGHTQPHSEVPAPQSRPAINFIKNRLSLFIYRQFKTQREKGQIMRLRIDDIKDAFPGMSDTSIRKRLKECAEFRRGGDDSGWWTAKKGLEIPTEEELQLLVMPEMVCKNESMLAGQLRLDDCGITPQANMAGFAASFARISSKIRDTIRFIEREGMHTPWNLTTNFINAVDGKEGARLNLLDVATQNLSTEEMEQLSSQAEAAISSVEADNILTAQASTAIPLSDQEAKKILIEKGGYAEEKVKRMTKADRKNHARRILDNERSGSLAGNTRKNAKELIKNTKFREVLLQIFTKESKKLTNGIPYYDNSIMNLLSLQNFEESATEKDISDDEDNMDLDDFERDLETMMEAQAVDEEEEEERELKRLRSIFSADNAQQRTAGGDESDEDSKSATRGAEAEPQSYDGQMFEQQPVREKRYIVRKTTYITNPDGSKTPKVEIIRDPTLVELYRRKKEFWENSKSKRKHKMFLQGDASDIFQSGTKERRKLLDQLRRYKKVKEEEKAGSTVKRRSALVGAQASTKKKSQRDKQSNKKPRKKPEGASKSTSSHKKKSSTAKQGSSEETKKNEHVKLEDGGKKIKIKKDAIKEGEKGKITIKLNKDLLKSAAEKKVSKRKVMDLTVNTSGSNTEWDYLSPKPQAKRRRKTAADQIASILGRILGKMKENINSLPFIIPVDVRVFPDYRKIVSKPIDLSLIEKRITDLTYVDHTKFLADVELMVQNAHIYCKDKFPHIPPQGDRLLALCKEELKKVEDEINQIINEPATPKTTTDDFNHSSTKV